MTRLILASGSAIRAQLLRQAGIEFERIPADIDEDAIKDEALLRGVSQKAVALRLAEAKALHISASHSGIVLGADQVLQLDKNLISKSVKLDEARDLLKRMSGKSHYLHAGSALAENGRILWSDVQSAELVVRRLSDAFIDDYLAREGEKLLSSVGCYQLEGAGVHLFEAIRGDYFTVLGLPMLPLLAQLRHLGSRIGMIKTLPTGAARVAGVVGQPIRNSLSPVLHNAWLREMQLNGVYAPFAPVDEHAFERLILSCRSNGISGLNITAPFKEVALRLADTVSDTARYAGSANLLTFDEEGSVHADSTDGHGLIRAFEIAAPNCDLSAGPVAIMGAGGAAKAAVAALLTKGCPLVRVINRTRARAEELVFAFGERVEACELSGCDSALSDCVAVINAASGGPHPLFETLPDHAAVMDMTYRPLKTAWLQAAEARGLQIVDGLHMLIEQARPSFAAFYGVEPFPGFDARALIMSRIEGGGMVRLGLTGSIGMGKSTVAAMFSDYGVPVWDADEAVHRLYAAPSPLAEYLTAAFGDVTSDGAVDRTKLSTALKNDPDGSARLNAIVHPAVVADREAFFDRYSGAPLVVADIPLLYETGAEALLDKVLVVSAPPQVQIKRVLSRPGMTAEKFNLILSRQIPDAEKRQRADYIIDTSQSLDDTRLFVRGVISDLT